MATVASVRRRRARPSMSVVSVAPERPPPLSLSRPSSPEPLRKRARAETKDAPEASAQPADLTAVHCTDGAPVPVVHARPTGSRDPQQRISEVSLRPYLESTEVKASEHYTGVRMLSLNNHVSTAEFSPYVPNLFAMTALAGAEHVVGRSVKIRFEHGFVIAHSDSGVVNIPGCSCPAAMHLVCADYRMLANRTGVIIQLESYGVHNIHATFSVGPQIDLARAYRTHHAGTLRPSVIDRLGFTFVNPRIAAMVFPTAMVVMLSQKTRESVVEGAELVAKFLSPYVTAPSRTSAILNWNARRPDGAPPVSPHINTLPHDLAVLFGEVTHRV
jgi:hypothetical protein